MSAESTKKKVRIRKAPQTMREKTASASVEKAPKRRHKITRGTKTVLKSGIKPIKRVAAKRPKLPENKATLAAGKILAPLKKVLRRLAPTYFVHSWREFRRVTWPSRRETWRLVLAVFVFSIIFGLAAYAVDSILDKLFKAFVLK